ncbi:hypothetical protein JXI42_06365 [bacterium]|nr:hypothetical protein [bacterium]
MKKKIRKGIRLVGILLTLTIVGTITAAMIPIYTEVVGNLRRFEAVKIIKDIWILEQKFYEENGFYIESTTPNVIPRIGWKSSPHLNWYDVNVKSGVSRNLSSSMLIIAEEIGDADNDGNTSEKIIIDQNGILYGDY